MTSTDPFAHSDAAYALGALDPAARAEFEAHLQTCPACRARVEDALATVALLGAPMPGDLDLADEVPPDTLLPGLLRRARQERVRRRAVTTSIAIAAAACLVALVVVLWPSSTSTPSPAPQALRAVAVSHITATAALVPKAWGTEIDVHCKYAESNAAGQHTYGLQVIDTAGQAHGAGSWTLSNAHSITFTGGTEVRRERIAKVQVTLADGTPILQLTL